MTVRELIAKLVEQAPNIDATVYISKENDDDLDDFEIIRIDNDGMENGINIDLKQI